MPVRLRGLAERLIGEPDVISGGLLSALPGRGVPANASLVFSSRTSDGDSRIRA